MSRSTFESPRNDKAPKKGAEHGTSGGLSSPSYWPGCTGRTLVQSQKPDAEAEREQQDNMPGV